MFLTHPCAPPRLALVAETAAAAHSLHQSPQHPRQLVHRWPTAWPPRAASDIASTAEGFAKVVQFARLASPYIEGHRGRTFVVLIPGDVVADSSAVSSVLDDILLLQGIGVRLVLVIGCGVQIDRALAKRGIHPRFVAGYRVTDPDTMQAALEACSANVALVQARLSKAPSMEMVRRHARSNARFQFRPVVGAVAGNYVTAKRRGALGGAQLGLTGKVRFVQVEDLRMQLDAGNIVVMGVMGYSAGGELLNCNAVDVATQTAVQLHADKLIFLTGGEVADLKLPYWLPVADAQRLLTDLYCKAQGLEPDVCQAPAALLGGAPPTAGSDAEDDPTADFDVDDPSALGFPTAVVAAVAACRDGVNRTHLVDARVDGSLLIELFSRDGFGTMVSQDLYSGIRTAVPNDVPAVGELLAMLARDGVPLPPCHEQALLDALPDVTVLETEGQPAACAWLQVCGAAPDGVGCGQLVAFVVHPGYRNRGRGDSLLDFAEQRARQRGLRRLLLHADPAAAAWFEQRAFVVVEDVAMCVPVGLTERGCDAALLWYCKTIYDLDADVEAPPGKRIGY